MNTKLLMAVSAAILGIAGIILTFAPDEISKLLDLPETNVIIFQILGALYLGFAAMNWMAKGNLIGGIYGKPICVGNLTHFLVAGLALIRLSLNRSVEVNFLIIALIYLSLAILFAIVFLNTPKSVKKNADANYKQKITSYD